MPKWFLAVAFALFGSAPCAAATDLGVMWADLPISLNVAAARIGGEPLASNGSCDQGHKDPCRWTSRDGVTFEAESDGAGHLQRIEAEWNSDEHPGAAGAFRASCSTITALVQPKWGKAQVAAAVSRTMAITGVKGTVPERQQVVGGVRLYGDRNAPAELRSPDSAFLQCGAAPNF